MVTKQPFFNTLKEIWKGESDKKTILIYFLLVFSIYLIGAIIGMLLYPGGFAFTEVYTSYLGGNTHNPLGYQIYNASEMISGILLIPYFIYYYKNLRANAKLLVFLASLFGILGLLGFAALGIYYQGADPLGHQISTWIAFGGFGLSAFLFLIIFFGRLIRKKEWPSIKQFLLVYGGLFSLLILSLLLSEGEEIIAFMNIPPEYFNGKFTEWLFLLIVMYWLVSMAFAAPASKKL